MDKVNIKSIGKENHLMSWRAEDDGDEEGNKSACMILDQRYLPVHHLGTGTYGTVWRAVDSASGESVAIKKCQSVFASRALARRTLREIKILRLLGGQHDNLINLIALLPPTNHHDFADVYLVMPPMETDLAVIIRSDQELSDQHLHFFSMQLLSALRFLHAQGVVHRDIKVRR